MELKLLEVVEEETSMIGLNRTFYGIETLILVLSFKVLWCLNRTFYGIETDVVEVEVLINDRLNRTFYGIETHKEGQM